MIETILFDQDGPLADETTRLFEIMRKRFPDEMAGHSGVREHFELAKNFPAHLHEAVEAIRREKDFYGSFQPVPGGIEAFHEAMSLGCEAFVCTSPVSHSQFCVSEKFEWVERHMGSDVLKRVIVTKDKTTARGDILIDDKPRVLGCLKPDWQHIIYDAPYNRANRLPRRVHWGNWKEVLGI